MAIRQYVGARYVPRFTGLYDATQIYDALDVVDNGAGTSYIAKKTVPAGTPVTNTDYWFVYGASSGAILNLQNRVGDLETLTNGNIDTANIKNDAITTDKIADGSVTRDKLADRYIINVGDSYQVGYDPGGNNDGWGAYLLNTFGLRGHNIGGIGGACFGRPEDEYRDPKKILADNPPTDIAHDKVTDIIAGFGYNDFKQLPVNIEAGIARFVTYCKSEYPNATVWLAPIGWAWSDNEDHVTPAEIATTYTTYINACATRDITIMTSCFGLLLGCNGLSSADYKHPNATGNRTIAAAMYAALKGQSYSTKGATYTIPISGSGYTGNIIGIVKTCDGVISLRVAASAQYSGAAIDLNFSTLPVAHHPFMFVGSGIVSNCLYTNKFLNCPVSLMFTSSGAIELAYVAINDTGTAFINAGSFRLANNSDFQPSITAIVGQN